MSSSDPNNNPNDPYRKNPYEEPPGQSYGQQQPYGQPPGPYGAPGGSPPGAMPGKVNSSRLIFLIAGGLQALFSLLAIVTFAAAQNELEDVYGDLGVGTGVYYTLFTLFLIHAIVGIALAVKFPQGGNGLRIGAVVWAAVLILIGLLALPLGLLWVALGIVCLVLLSSAESAGWFHRPRT
ncbi:MAG TPA: hypothetical protein VE546_00355 [Streptomyces sp.]|uniref:hypothetical protein n=1 Tax=Streptomyces sp. TaxID=1931 RepID=UPI002D711A04|nr:hypothetical protein [Streptomyces sp.]HZG02019.1 hypothetical protein [Streptomyces sp.]